MEEINRPEKNIKVEKVDNTQKKMRKIDPIVNIGIFDFPTDGRKLFKYYEIPNDKEDIVEEKLEGKDFFISRFADNSPYAKSYLILHGQKRKYHELSEMSFELEEKGFLEGKNLKIFLAEILARNLEKQGWRPTYINNRAFLETTGSNTISLNLTNKEVNVIENGGFSSNGIIILKTMEISIHEFDGIFYVSIDTKSNFLTTKTVIDDEFIVKSSNTKYFCCPYYKCSKSVRGECEYSLQFARKTIHKLEILDHRTNEPHPKNNFKIFDFFNDNDKCATGYWLDDLKKGESVVEGKMGNWTGSFAASGIRTSLRTDQIRENLTIKIADNVILSPDYRYNSFKRFLDELSTFTVCGRSFHISFPVEFKSKKFRKPKYYISGKSSDQINIRQKDFRPLKKGGFRNKFGIIYDPNLKISDAYKYQIESFFDNSRTGKFKGINMEQMFKIQIDLLLVKSLEELGDIVNEIKGLVVISSHEEFRKTTRKIARQHGIGYKAMKPDPENDFTKKQSNVALGLYLSSIGYGWKLKNQVNSWLGIYFNSNIISACLIDQTGNVETNFVWRSQNIVDEISTVINHYNCNTIIAGTMYNSLYPKIAEKVSVPIFRMNDQNSLRVYSIEDHRRLSNPMWVMLSSSEALIVDPYTDQDNQEVDDESQGTPKPIFLSKINENNINEDELNQLLKLKFMVPWYDGNYSRIPLPIWAAKRAHRREPLNYYDLPNFSLNWYEYVWFA